MHRLFAGRVPRRRDLAGATAALGELGESVAQTVYSCTNPATWRRAVASGCNAFAGGLGSAAGMSGPT